jgi:hypothetical protein
MRMQNKVWWGVRIETGELEGNYGLMLVGEKSVEIVNPETSFPAARRQTG